VTEPKSVLRPVDTEAVRLAKTLIRTARHGTIATLEPGSGRPIATRVGLCTDTDGTPIILVSALSAHTPALEADPRCSVLIGEPGKGDPLAHPRITLSCDATPIGRNGAEEARLASRYLAHQPKAQLYAALPDFSYFRLHIRSASLNAGFGKAYALSPDDVLTRSAVLADIAEAEAGAIAHMNGDHAEAVALYARHFAQAPDGRWVLTGVDPEGFEITNGDDVRRIFFATPLTSARDLHTTLVRMAEQARAAASA